MTDFHTDDHPAELDNVEAQSGRRSPKFWWMFVISTTLVVIAMIAVFMFTAA
ncbi:hypothetical protein ACFFUB_06585 [Algimonas porphyrae]|uniref:Uncharacterized protein n=1 Tax=Algimonas porphyrae TaxID=1128113 RepID=A0ABQ5V3L3_9PROT|nr:hypothetical protein [Algimonas porphyrae]GLQ21171.1 hypothetical protein GCM10007854_21260 [Algimonas porphyrae]